MPEPSQSNEYSVKPFYDKLNLVFNAILAPPLLAFVWAYLESTAGNLEPILDESSVNTVNFIMPLVVFGLIITSFYLFRNRLSTIEPSKSLSQKLEEYFTTCIVMYALLEFGLIISVVGYYLTLGNVFLGMFVVVLVFFSLHKPTPYRIAKNLRLKGDEKEQMIYKR